MKATIQKVVTAALLCGVAAFMGAVMVILFIAGVIGRPKRIKRRYWTQKEVNRMDVDRLRFLNFTPVPGGYIVTTPSNEQVPPPL